MPEGHVDAPNNDDANVHALPATRQPTLNGDTSSPHSPQQNGLHSDSNGVTVKEEDGGCTSGGESPAHLTNGKKRKFDTISKSNRTSRGPSPPWKKIAAEGPTSVIVDGKRKSTRNPSAAPNPSDTESASQSDAKVKFEKAPWKKAYHEGPTTVFVDGKRKSTRVSAADSSPDKLVDSPGKLVKISPPWKKAGAEGPTTVMVDGKRTSTRRHTLPAAESPSDSLKKSKKEGTKRLGEVGISQKKTVNGVTHKKEKSVDASGDGNIDVVPRRKPGRPPKNAAAQALNGINHATPVSKHRRASSRTSLTHNLENEPQQSSPSTYVPRLKLRLNLPKLEKLPHGNPLHYPRPAKFASFSDWVAQDDPFEGENVGRPTAAQAMKEAKRRRRLAKATESGGPLSADRCSRLVRGGVNEPKERYGHINFLGAHAINFRKLMLIEHERHRKTAKSLAQACEREVSTNDKWRFLREAKTAEQLEKEQIKYQIIRYKQVARDLAQKWSMAGLEVDRIRLKKWEEEQEALGKKAMDEMLEQSEALLRQNSLPDTSLLDDDDEDLYDEISKGSLSDDETLGFGRVHGSDEGDEIRSDDENMTDSSEEDEIEQQTVEGATDDDSLLSPEALRKKYADLLVETPQESDSEADEDDPAEEVVDEESEEEDGLDTAEISFHTADSSGASPSQNKAVLQPDGDLQTAKIDEEPARDENTDGGTAEVEDDLANYQPPELDEVDDALLDSDEDASTDMDSDMGSDDAEEWGSSDAGSDADEDDGDANGMLGFFFSKKELKKVSHENDEDGQEDANAGAEAIEKEDPVMATAKEQPDDGNAEDAATATSPRSMDISSNAEDAEPRSTPHSTPQTPRSETFSQASSAHALQKVEVPDQLLRGTLRAYQHDGLDWLAKLYVGGRNGILADEMGLGKTIQTISLLAHVAVHHEIWGPHLVVVPTSVMLNWEMEFKKWCPGFKILTYYGNIEERKQMRKGWQDDDKINVCITSYQLILQDAAAFKRRSWHYLILDEAHNIKNFQTQRWQTLLTFRTHSRLLLTGTPLQNNLQELWSLLYFLMPGGMDNTGGFADLEKFLNSLKKPADQILDQGRQKLDAEAQARVNKLHEVLRPFLLRRLKSEVEKQMPGKYEHVIYCRLSKRQRQLYDEFMGRADTKQTLSSGNYLSIINCLMSLRKVCNHPDLFETRQIVTSFAMRKSAVAGYEIKEMLIRRRLLADADSKLDLDFCGLLPAGHEYETRNGMSQSHRLNPMKRLEDLQKRQRELIVELGNKESLSNPKAQLRAHESILESLQRCAVQVNATTRRAPMYGSDLVAFLTLPSRYTPRFPTRKQQLTEYTPGTWALNHNHLLQSMMPSLPEVAERCNPLVQKFTCVTPAVVAEDVLPLALTKQGQMLISQSSALPAQRTDPYHQARIRHSIQFPDKRLLQYDCGKLQALAKLLRKLQAGGHRCLIFTQMTKVLDILEQFLNIHGHRYLRLDGATKVEQRQILTDRFNNDTRILAFILSSRSGGLGINLTGADTVIFYDLDWNPAMDAQCQDRCHRIGQTRDVHIYRLVSEFTIEANILRKSNQKRLLDDVIIQKGDFTVDTFRRVTAKDAFTDEDETERGDDEAGQAMDRILGDAGGLGKEFEGAEDTEDTVAAKAAALEMTSTDVADFADAPKVGAGTDAAAGKDTISALDDAMEQVQAEADDNFPHVDEYMVRYLLHQLQGVPIVMPNATNQRKRGRKGKDWAHGRR